jgi:hypothetical protein
MRANVKQVPPYIFPLLIASKRLHSIFMLRCFNDCFAVLFFWLAVFCYQRNQWHIGSALYSTGLNVKMSLLLPLPAMGVLMVMKLGGREALTQAMIIVQVSVSSLLSVSQDKCVYLDANKNRFYTATPSASAHLATLRAPSTSAAPFSTDGP